MYKIRTINRISDILNLYSEDIPVLGVSEVACKLGLNINTAGRLMSNLEAVGMLKRTAKGRKYHLGNKFPELARVFLASIDLREIAMPYLKEINDKTHEQVSLSVIDGDKVLRLVYIESSKIIRRFINPEKPYGPLHASAAGKLLMANLSDKQIDELLKRAGLYRFTENTITNRKDMRKEIEKIRETGIAVCKGELTDLLCSFSAPVSDYSGRIIAALSVTTIIANCPPEIAEEYTVLVREAANKISRELGYKS